MTPHTFLFDMDGTLLDSSAAVVDAVAAGLLRAYDHHGLAPAPADRSLISRCMGLPTDAYFRAAFAPDTVPESLREEFAVTYGHFTADAEEEAVSAGATRLYNAVPDALDALRAQGHRLLLFSNAGARYFRAIMAGHGLERWFERTTAYLTPEQKADLKRKMSRSEAVNATEQRIQEIAYNVALHYEQNWRGTGFKAQLAVPSKEIGRKYLNYLRSKRK